MVNPGRFSHQKSRFSRVKTPFPETSLQFQCFAKWRWRTWWQFQQGTGTCHEKKVQQDLSQPGCKAWNKRKCIKISYGSFWDGWIHESNLPGYVLEESYVRSLVRSQWDSLRFCRGQKRRLPPPTKRRPLSWTRLAKDGGLHSVDTFGSLPDP